MRRQLLAEFLGTAALLAIVVGSGIMGERLAAGNAAVALLANSIATGAGLFVLIVTFAPVSGAHFNPAVTLLGLLRRDLALPAAALYCVVQVVGAVAGVMLAHAMFGLALAQTSTHVRSSVGELIGELVATTGLLVVIGGAKRASIPMVAGLVAAYITAAYWFTSSTSFANPAVTIARALTDTFAGIAPASVVLFIAAQMVSVALGMGLVRVLFPVMRET